MSRFTRQKIVRSSDLGAKLSEARLEQNISLERAVKDLNIAFKYLEALEANNLRALPGKPYLKNFLRKYSQYLNLNFNDCWESAKELEQIQAKKFGRIEGKYFLLLPKFIKRFTAIALVLLVLIFLAIKVQSIFAPPPLLIYNPKDGFITDTREIAVSGHSQKEANIVINNLTVYVDDSGNFQATIDLQKGLNLIKITANKRYSRPREVDLRVLLKE